MDTDDLRQKVPEIMAFRRLAILLLALLLVAKAHADLPTPRLDRLTPLGGAAGTTVDLEIVGPDLEGVESLLFDHPGLKAVFVKERQFRLTIAADVSARHLRCPPRRPLRRQ